MRIRKQQITSLNRELEQAFEQRMREFLVAEFPEARDEPQEEFRPEVSTQIGKARGYGMTSEQDVATYVVTAWLLGADFDTEFPAAAEVLTADISGEMKSTFLEEWTSEMMETLES